MSFEKKYFNIFLFNILTFNIPGKLVIAHMPGMTPDVLGDERTD
jgi:hypothetical protein